MFLTGTLIAFGLRQLSEASDDGLGEWIAEHLGGDALGKWIANRFTDHSDALPRAVDRAHGRAWEAVGLALGGEGSWGEWFKDLRRDADLKAMRERVRAFLAATPKTEREANALRVASRV
jgi:hypothetical protein